MFLGPQENQEVLASGLAVLLDKTCPLLEARQCFQVPQTVDWPDGDLTSVSSVYQSTLVMLAIWSWFSEGLQPLLCIEVQKAYWLSLIFHSR